MKTEVELQLSVWLIDQSLVFFHWIKLSFTSEPAETTAKSIKIKGYIKNTFIEIATTV